MKTTILLTTCGAFCLLASCASMDPDYQAYKKQKKAEAAAATSAANNPYDAPAASGNQFGVPPHFPGNHNQLQNH